MKFVVCLISILCFTSIVNGQNIEDNRAQMEVVIEKLIKDSNHQFLKTLVPQKGDFFKIFVSKELADKVLEYSNSKWINIENVPDDSMKPTCKEYRVNVLHVSKEELANNVLNGFPEDYQILSSFLKEGTTLYALQYLNSDNTVQKTRAAFFKVDDRWLIIPQPFKAFQN